MNKKGSILPVIIIVGLIFIAVIVWLINRNESETTDTTTDISVDENEYWGPMEEEFVIQPGNDKVIENPPVALSEQNRLESDPHLFVFPEAVLLTSQTNEEGLTSSEWEVSQEAAPSVPLVMAWYLDKVMMHNGIVIEMPSDPASILLQTAEFELHNTVYSIEVELLDNVIRIKVESL